MMKNIEDLGGNDQDKKEIWNQYKQTLQETLQFADDLELLSSWKKWYWVKSNWLINKWDITRWEIITLKDLWLIEREI